MNNSPWTKLRITHDSPVFCTYDGHGNALAYTDEETADKLLAAHNATPEVAYKERMEGFERELSEIDNILDRRDALDDLPTRAAKVLKAIEMARNTDPHDDLGQLRDSVMHFLTVWDGAEMKSRLPVFADAVKRLRDARDHVGK